tara:strand:- start:214 stop:789 length:576 start_codon:yes stop_codon:yes gene_type:complete
MEQSQVIGVLIECAESNQLCEMFYRKSVAREATLPRLVEPYHFVTGKQDTLVRCYQQMPEEGWRTFMLHKIESVQPTDFEYDPRRKQSLSTAEVKHSYQPSSFWTEPRKLYRDMICDALADGTVDALEFIEIKQLIQEFNLKIEDIRFVHASLFSRALEAIISDGFVSDEEEQEIRFLHRVFKKLGWSIGS